MVKRNRRDGPGCKTIQPYLGPRSRPRRRPRRRRGPASTSGLSGPSCAVHVMQGKAGIRTRCSSNSNPCLSPRIPRPGTLKTYRQLRRPATVATGATVAAVAWRLTSSRGCRHHYELGQVLLLWLASWIDHGLWCVLSIYRQRGVQYFTDEKKCMRNQYHTYTPSLEFIEASGRPGLAHHSSKSIKLSSKHEAKAVLFSWIQWTT